MDGHVDFVATVPYNQYAVVGSALGSGAKTLLLWDTVAAQGHPGQIIKQVNSITTDTAIERN
jgi:hypothetical protein